MFLRINICINNRKTPAPKHNVIVQDKQFETHRLKIQKDDILYVFSDGITDQFDRNDAQKIGTPRLRDWVKEMPSTPFKAQKMS